MYCEDGTADLLSGDPGDGDENDGGIEFLLLDDGDDGERGDGLMEFVGDRATDFQTGTKTIGEYLK